MKRHKRTHISDPLDAILTSVVARSTNEDGDTGNPSAELGTIERVHTQLLIP